jgi:hypothetical protein
MLNRFKKAPRETLERLRVSMRSGGTESELRVREAFDAALT